MSDPLVEIAEFAGRACGIIVKDVAEASQPLAAAFRRGWREALTGQSKTEAAPSASKTAAEST